MSRKRKRNKKQHQDEKNKKNHEGWLALGILIIIINFIFTLVVFQDYILPRIESVPVSALMKFNTKDPLEKRVVLTKIADTRNISFLPKVAKCLDDQDPEVRKAAAEALVKYGRNGTIPYLSKTLKDENEGVRIVAAKSLTALRNNEGIKLLFDYYMDPAHNFPAVIRDYLGILPASVEPLAADKLTDKNPVVRKAAAELLVKAANKKTVDKLAAALSDSNKETKTIIVSALGNTNSAKAADVLEKCLGTEDDLFDIAVIKSSGKLGDASIPFLIRAFNNKKLSVTTYNQIADTIVSMGGENIPRLITMLENEKDTGTSEWIMEILARFGDGRGVKVIIDKGNGKDKTLTEKAISALPRMKNPENVSVLLEAFKSSNPLLRRAVVENYIKLGQVGHPVLMMNFSDNIETPVKKCSIGVIGISGIANNQAKQWLMNEYPKNKDILGIEDYEAFIRFGIASSEKDLLKLLDKYNDLNMANAFFRSGNETLANGAYKWASKFNGKYKINPVPSPNDIKWNSL
ncbi:MAG: HEAT repeat domain-containing protein [Firmicutes bacterium]|nr:HEAT repeat domain-containing protein [Bacillota bacterium]